MLREYAIQPEVLADLNAIRFFLDQTGVNQGRMISRYPKRWIAMVYNACASCRPLEKKRIEIRLKDIERKVIHTGRPYDGNGRSWVDNALVEHAREPFTGVILVDSDPAPRSGMVVSASCVDETCPCWRISRDAVVNRDAESLCRPAVHLLRMATEIVFVDRYFGGNASHGRPLAAFLQEALNGSKPKRLEYHSEAGSSWDHLRDKLLKMIPFLPLPPGIPLKFVRWETLPQGDGLHPRYILTEHGGIKYDWGLGEDAGKTTDIHLLDAAIYARRWSEYSATSTAFKFVDGFEVLDGQLYRLGLVAGRFCNVGQI